MPSPLADAVSGLVNWLPAPLEAVAVCERGAPRPLRRGEPVTVLTWNLQFCGSRHHWFFYDGGPDVHVPPQHVAEALEGVGALLDREQADLVLLQEVDRDSARTGRVDQLAALLARRPVARWMSTPYHRSRFVPVPPRTPLGRIDLELAVLSAYPLGAGVRTALPMLREPWIRQQFNLHRALLTTTVPIDGGGELAVGVTHLSAFSRGDGTLAAQVDVLRAWIEAQRAAGRSFVLAGDLNLLPPGDDPARLGAGASEYAEGSPPVARLFEVARSAVPADRLLDPAAYTYLPPGAVTPDRVLDYVFVSDDLVVQEAGPVPMDPMISDHVPVRVRFVLPD